MRIYCLHHTDAAYRKERLQKVFQHQKLLVHWVENFHPKTIDKSQLNLQHPLKDAAISLYLKHKWCVQQQVNDHLTHVIILEDDVNIPDSLNCVNYFSRICHEFDELSGDVLNIGTAYNMRPSFLEKDRLVYSEPHFTTRCAHAYALSLKCAKKIINDLDVIDDAWDWKLNHLISKYGLKSCYVEPGLTQMSLNGEDQSLVQ